MISVTFSPFISMGSGSVPAYGILESGYKDNLTQDEAQNLAVNAIKAGILYDQGSGSNVDFVILKKGKTDYFRNFEIVGQKLFKKQKPYQFLPNNIRLLNSCVAKSRNYADAGDKG